MQVKKYHLPLTQEMLLKIHLEKQRTKEKARVVEEAQAEAKERMAKWKLLLQQRLQGRPIRINAVTLTNFEEEMVDPIIQVKVGTTQMHAHALIDSGAQGNLISLDLYNQLKNTEHQASNKEIKGYTGSQKQVQGFAILPVHIGSQCYPYRFFIVDTQEEKY